MGDLLENIAQWWRYEVDGALLAVAASFLAAFGLAGLFVYTSVLESREWETFSVDHQCKVVAHSKGGTSTGFGITANGSPGTVVVSEPDRTAYLCDDGITYWR